MWMLKGLLAGIVIFGLLSVIYHVYANWPPRPNAAIGLSAILGLTIYQPLYWVVFVLTVSTCCFYAKLLHSIR
jgi:uncharacterized membrane protein